MPVSPFVFAIGDLLRADGEPRRVAIEVPVSWGIEMTRTVPDVPLLADLTLGHVSGGVLVRGVVSTMIDNVCNRCLTESRESLEIEVAQMFVPHRSDDEDVESEDYELDGDAIDLESMLRDEVILAMPMVPTCRDGCSGVVAMLQSDLNTLPPEGESESGSPFAVLQDLFDDGE